MLSPELVRTALDSAPDAMVIVDADGSIVFTNRQVTALFGYEPLELLGKQVESLLPQRFRAHHAGHRRDYGAHLRVRPMGAGLDLAALRKDGTEFPVEISLSPITDDGSRLVAAAIRDTTDRHEIERELREARESADRANLAKSRFLATASHDLRQPLQALALLNGSMRRLTRDDALREALLQEKQTIDAMSRLLNALLDIGKLESGAIRPVMTVFSIASLLEELRAEFDGLAVSKGLRLELQTGADRVHSDPSLVGQMVRNLVSNAIKYTNEGHVLVRCQREGACVRLEIRDTGFGIPAEEIPRICDDFYQVGIPTNMTREGYGLGLGIVSRIVTLLGLKLDVRSEVGKGSVFSIGLPVSPACAEVPGSVGRTQYDVPLPRRSHAPILLVEDDPGVRNATRLLLKVAGYEVLAAASLQEAVELATAQRTIGLLLTDYHLAARETGVQVIAAVRDIVAPHLNVILMTGDTSSAMQTLAPDEHLWATSKPVDAESLLALINELFDG